MCRANDNQVVIAVVEQRHDRRHPTLVAIDEECVVEFGVGIHFEQQLFFKKRDIAATPRDNHFINEHFHALSFDD